MYKIEEEIVDVSVSALLSVQRTNRYGSVPGLEDEELADPDELERQVVMEQWWPVLRLPAKTQSSSIWPVVNEDGGVHWGAFGTVDFERTMPEFDKSRYKADKLREKLKDVLIIAETVRDRLPVKACGQVLRFLRRGIIQREHIVSEDMLLLVRLHDRARHLRQEIAELQQASWARRCRQAERFWAER